jgi:hypothetical protein
MVRDEPISEGKVRVENPSITFKKLSFNKLYKIVRE